MQLVQLDEPEPDAPAMCVHTTAGDIVAELYPDEAPDYVAQFTKLAESGYYDNTYIFQVEDGVYFEAGTPNEDGTLTAGTDDTYEKWSGKPAQTSGRSVAHSVRRELRRTARSGPSHRQCQKLLRHTLCGLQFHRVR